MHESFSHSKENQVYQLTLSQSDRQAIDFCGDRYPHGDDLFKILIHCDTQPEADGWYYPGPLTFQIPENIAWEIAELLKDSDYSLLGDNLKYKLLTFIDSIV